MVSETKLEKVENVVENIGNFMMAGMMEAIGGIMGELGQGMDDIFQRVKGEAPDPDRTVAVSIRERLSPTSITAIEEMLASDTEIDEEAHEAFVKHATDAHVDPLIDGIEQYDFGLPKFTEKLTPEAFAGYLYLAQSEDKQFEEMFGSIMPALEQLPQ